MEHSPFWEAVAELIKKFADIWESLKFNCSSVEPNIGHKLEPNYEGESVYRSQIDTKYKTCCIWHWKGHLFLDVSSTNIYKTVISLYECFEILSLEVFGLLSRPFLHLHFNILIISEMFATFLDLAMNRFTRQIFPTLNRKHFIINSLWIEFFCPQ
jgi:hypothetical protein